MKKILFVLLSLCCSMNAYSQLGGFGFYPHYAMTNQSEKFQFTGRHQSQSYGATFYREGYGFMLNTQIGAGYLRKNAFSNDSLGGLVSVERDYLQLIPSVKYWFGNAIRAGQIFGLKCAHKTKIIYNYNFKPYLIVGLPFEILINKSKSGENNPFPFAKTNWSLFTGIGSNLFEMGGNYNPKMIFAEVRIYQDLNRFFQDGPDKNTFSWGIQAVIGLKFERD